MSCDQIIVYDLWNTVNWIEFVCVKQTAQHSGKFLFKSLVRFKWHSHVCVTNTLGRQPVILQERVKQLGASKTHCLTHYVSFLQKPKCKMTICVFMCGFVWEFVLAARLQTLGAAAGCLATKLTRVGCLLMLNRQTQGETESTQQLELKTSSWSLKTLDDHRGGNTQRV